jgi:Flp pilus assembly protein TadD
MSPTRKSFTQAEAMQAARLRVEAGQLAEAERLYREVLAANPEAADAHHNLGYVLERAGRSEEAERSFRAALALRPDSADANSNLGNLLSRLGRKEEAERHLRAALATVPRHFQALNNLGIVLQHLGRISESVGTFQQAVEANPGSAEVHSNLGSALVHARQLAEAERHCRRALELSRGYANAHYNLGVVLQQSGRFAEAEQSYRAAIASAPRMAAAHQNLATLLLARGDFAEGFREYEWRVLATYGRDYLVDPRSSSQTLQRPSGFASIDWAGKRVVLLSDQGIGDELFFLRFAPSLRARGARLAYGPPPKLAGIVARSGWVDEVIAAGDESTQFDHAFAVSELALVAGAPYSPLPPSLRIGARPDRIEAMRARLAGFGPRPWIGVTWRAGTGFKVSEYASLLSKRVDPTLLGKSLAALPGSLVSLQRGPSHAETVLLEQALGRRALDLSVANEDLEDMCALLSVLDAYVGVSNTNMHLCAAVGRTASVLVPWPPEWRWMAQGRESPWFPGFGVYRQDADESWQSALNDLTSALELLK